LGGGGWGRGAPSVVVKTSYEANKRRWRKFRTKEEGPKKKVMNISFIKRGTNKSYQLKFGVACR